MDKRQAAPWIAANKFGLGLRPNERAAIASDPRGWLKAQLSQVAVMPPALLPFADSPALLLEGRELQLRLSELGKRALEPGVKEQQAQIRKTIAARQEEQQKARLLAAIDSEAPFAERLVRFWSNHFTVVAGGGGTKDLLRHIAVPYENEAIRSNLDRSFAELLLAVEQHPAMLIYLDNHSSVGPNSKTGIAQKKGLNENLARELLELHTLGVDGGYGQEDVTALARILTGWGVDLRTGLTPDKYGSTLPGTYRFALVHHEPGEHTVLGRTYAVPGEQRGEKALRDLAHHPSTARHIARKLVRHFVADDPPPEAVEKIERVFLETGGWLPAVHGALIELEQAWDPQYRKLKSPEDLVVSVARGCMLPGRSEQPQLVLRSLNQALKTFGQTPFNAGSPAGWADTAAAWGNPDAILKRIQWFTALTKLIPAGLDPLQLAQELLPPHDALLTELKRAESEQQGLVLLFGSPSFQWRGV